MAEYHKNMVEQGFTVFRQKFDQMLLYDISHTKISWDIPQRGHDRDGNYYATYHENVEWSNYWTLPLNDHNQISNVREVTDQFVEEFMDDPVFYHADCSVLTPLSSGPRPHVDTPHRHAPWNRDRRLLGIQIAIPLHEFTENSGSTAFLPGSHKRVWEIDRCYRGEYTEQFIQEAIQPVVHFGDMLMWDARTLHSQMPNITATKRYMLLMNYIDRRVVNDVMQYETAQFGGHV